MDRRQFLRCLLPLLATLFAAAAPAQVRDSAKHRFVLKTLTEGLEHPGCSAASAANSVSERS